MDIDKMIARLDNFCANLEAQPDVVYYRCSMDRAHSERCKEYNLHEGAGSYRTFTRLDGEAPTECEELNKWEVAIHHERGLWTMAGMDPANVGMDLYAMNVSIQAIIEVLETHLGVSAEELQTTYLKKMYKDLHEFRVLHEDAIKSQRAQAMLRGGVGRPRIIGPNGTPIDL